MVEVVGRIGEAIRAVPLRRIWRQLRGDTNRRAVQAERKKDLLAQEVLVAPPGAAGDRVAEEPVSKICILKAYYWSGRPLRIRQREPLLPKDVPIASDGGREGG